LQGLWRDLFLLCKPRGWTLLKQFELNWATVFQYSYQNIKFLNKSVKHFTMSNAFIFIKNVTI
jgi:hypothetical protein